MRNELEKKVVDGAFIYIDGVAFDAKEKCLFLKFINNPEKPVASRVLTFSDVQDFEDEWDSEEDRIEAENCLDSLIGLDEYPEAESVRYVVRLEARELRFCTSKTPMLHIAE